MSESFNDNNNYCKDGYSSPDTQRYGENSYRQGYSPYENNDRFYAQNSYNPSSNGQYRPYGNYIQKKSMWQRIKELFSSRVMEGLVSTASLIGIAVLLYLLFSNLLSSLLMVKKISELYTENNLFKPVFEMLYTVICVGGAFGIAYSFMHKSKKLSFTIDFSAPRKNSNIILMIVAGMGILYVGNVFTSYFATICSSFGIEFASFKQMLEMQQNTIPESIFELILMIVHMAVFPALLEEFAFRGVIMQSLRKYGDWFAIIMSALIFGLVHGNMTQMPFAVLAGIVLGYINVVTGSIWISILLHFLNNFLSLVHSMMISSLSEMGTLVYSAIHTYGIILIGMIAFIFYTRVNKNWIRLRRGIYPNLPAKHKVTVFLLTPTVLLAFIIMMANLATDVIMGSIMK